MPAYTPETYTVENALSNIGDYFWELYYPSLYEYAKFPDRRKDIGDKIHAEWDSYGLSPYGTEIRLEWATQIYKHGDWERALLIKSQAKKRQG